MWLVEPVLPLPRLIIAGAGHVGKAVAQLGSLLDFSVTVIDDRAEFANAVNVPEADEIVMDEFDQAIGKIEDSPDNYFVIVTRGHQKDAEALRAAIGRKAAYIGMIGSKRKIELMHCEFLESGWATAAQWAGIHAPIGIDIGSRTVEEIAVSIAAELVRVRSEAGGGGPAVIWAIILAAGESRRMGTQKLLLPSGGTTVVGAVVRTAQASRAGRTLVVLGSDHEAIRGELGLLGGNAMSKSRDRPGIPTQPASRGVDFVVNENYPLGMLTSIQAGLRALPADAQAAIVLLGDQPFLASRVIDAVIAAYEAGRNGIVIPTFQGRRGHPILVDLKYRDEVLAIDPPKASAV